ncbi:MAG: O-antigen ligase family protein [Rubricoccaceae bacterium]
MELRYSPPPLTPPQHLGDRYMLVLAACLLGYALLGRAFAYVGVPPLFIGEVVLGLGLLLLVTRARALASLSGMPVLGLLLLLIAWGLVRTLPYVPEYGLNAFRDWMVLGYGLFAFVAAGLILSRPERLRLLVERYRVFAVVMLALVWAVYIAFKVFEQSLPWIPWAPGAARVVEAKGGDIMVHISAIAAFVVLGLIRPTPLVVAALAANAGLIMVSNRGGMIAFVLTLAVAWALRPPTAHFGKLIFAFVFFLAAGLLVGPTVQIHGGTRSISVEQLWTNLVSIVDQSDSASLETTKTWRLAWWTRIVGYTVQGPYFWDGKGFGINLAVDDGFQTSDDAALRSPHNGYMTILARMGVPAFVVWLVLQGLWVLTMLSAWWEARLLQQRTWMAVLAMLLCYWVAITVNAMFEVYLESPMGGIWLWVVVGTGLAAARLRRTRPDLFADADRARLGLPRLGLPVVRAIPSTPVPWHWGARTGDGAAGRPPVGLPSVGSRARR